MQTNTSQRESGKQMDIHPVQIATNAGIAQRLTFNLAPMTRWPCVVVLCLVRSFVYLRAHYSTLTASVEPRLTPMREWEEKESNRKEIYSSPFPLTYNHVEPWSLATRRENKKKHFLCPPLETRVCVCAHILTATKDYAAARCKPNFCTIALVSWFHRVRCACLREGKWRMICTCCCHQPEFGGQCPIES